MCFRIIYYQCFVRTKSLQCENENNDKKKLSSDSIIDSNSDTEYNLNSNVENATPQIK